MTLQMMTMAAKGTLRASTPRSARGNSKGNYKSQSLSYGPGGACENPKILSDPELAKAGGAVPILDLSILGVLADPTHRFNYTERSITHDERDSARDSSRNTYRPAIAPAWLKHDRQVLRFYAYFQEAVHENPKENFRVRKCAICFYLEDGTMLVSEPKMENSGIPQGNFVKRHRIPKPGGGYYTYHDLKVGITISIYSRAFRITGCDDFTRKFFQTALNIDVGEVEAAPLDAFTARSMGGDGASVQQKKEIAESKEYNELAHGGNRKNIKLQQYLENDGKVLSFKCYWDDPTRYGSRMYYSLHYYLADDTVEVLDELSRNSGRDPYPVFWRRAPLRWNPHVSPAPGMIEPEAIVYKPEDLVVGQSVTVYGRQICLYDCDNFTRAFYQDYMGHEQDSIPIQHPKPVHFQLANPPHTGFGTEADSLASCIHLTPRVPSRDINKLMNEVKRIMRFEARAKNSKKEDENRRFIVGVFVADGSVGVWETKQRNSGHTEGKFAFKSQKKNTATGTWFKPSDFIVGETVEINSTPFQLLRADECTLSYMEDNCDDFPVSDMRVICRKIAGLRNELEKVAEIAPEELRRLAEEKCNVYLHAHELVTVVRALCSGEADPVTGSVKDSIPTQALLQRLR